MSGEEALAITAGALAGSVAMLGLGVAPVIEGAGNARPDQLPKPGITMSSYAGCARDELYEALPLLWARLAFLAGRAARVRVL